MLCVATSAGFATDFVTAGLGIVCVGTDVVSTFGMLVSALSDALVKILGCATGLGGVTFFTGSGGLMVAGLPPVLVRQKERIRVLFY